MSEVMRIRDQLKRATMGPAWHGPSLRKLLRGVSAARAARRPLPRAHTIWEIVLHIAVWRRVAARRLAGFRARATGTRNWPRVRDTSERAWRRAVADLEASYRELHRAIGRVRDGDLGRRTPTREMSIYGMLHGVVQHDLYHAGQIAVLRKAG